ncbi:MAG: zinc ribbon domain-containing protein [Ectothiorhodospiraceae bacterium]|nr:zinc ribbon domain-containing protein [Ectothiorhodospiraceae bacterium]MCH8503188.1 zinc ribbon domain-containing protein [Ectothiorhodospiraceae bacterium]
MPIYEYQCEACGHDLEAIQKMSDAPLTECPACGKPALRKKISAAGFRLKGGGWYETDFKSGSKRNLAGDSAKGGSDSKPAAESKPAAGSKPAAESKSSATGSGKTASA